MTVSYQVTQSRKKRQSKVQEDKVWEDRQSTVSAWIQSHSWIQPQPSKTQIKLFQNYQVFIQTVLLGPGNGSNSKCDA